ncbi:hypothetical protein LR48_Vigan08g120800 [Vigna angularis]|uniref:Uncharacterized protein n=1 Tax=Phaseolus angularis TaxID=3914 RepID=A0A0L9V5R0_PHAAN|nr:hypothetical protein LR48_Vigan08g120800 [Vigna angularis]
MTTAAEVPFLLHEAVTVLPPPSPMKPVFIDSNDMTNSSCQTTSYGRGRRSPLPWSLQCSFRYWKWQLRLSSTVVSTVMTMTTPRPTLVTTYTSAMKGYYFGCFGFMTAVPEPRRRRTTEGDDERPKTVTNSRCRRRTAKGDNEQRSSRE